MKKRGNGKKRGYTKKETAQKRVSQWVEVWGRLKKNKLAMVALAILVIIVFSAVFADFIAPYSYSKQSIRNSFQYPSREHLLGTDNFGRDILSRIIYGGRISLLVSVLAVAFGLVIGCTLGAVAAYFGGFAETVIMRALDIVMSIPAFLLAVTISAALGSGVLNSAIAIGAGTMPAFARIMRANVLTIKQQEYVEAARATGSKDIRIIFKHIVPNTISPIIVNSTLRIGTSILQIASLSFIGLGVQPPTPEWGSILSAGRDFFRDFWPIVTFPGIAIMITLFSFNILGDGLRDALDPRLKR